MSNEELYDAAVEAANSLHGDTSVSMRETLTQLRSLRGEIDTLIDAVESDISREEREVTPSDQALACSAWLDFRGAQKPTAPEAH